MLTRGVCQSFLILCLVLIPLLSVLPTAVSQTNFTTITSAYTLTSSVGTGTRTTITSFQTNTTSLTVNLTTSLTSTYTSTSTSTSTTTSIPPAPSLPSDNTTILLVIGNIIVLIFLIFAVMRYLKRRRK